MVLQATTPAPDTTQTAVGPLTTTFTPPGTACLQDVWLSFQNPPPSGFSELVLGPATSVSSCFPSGWATGNE
jgi:hypothetical protein